MCIDRASFVIFFQGEESEFWVLTYGLHTRLRVLRGRSPAVLDSAPGWSTGGALKSTPRTFLWISVAGSDLFGDGKGSNPLTPPPRKIQPCVYNFLIKELNQVLMQMSVGILSLSSSSSLLWLSLFWAQQIQYNCVCVCVCVLACDPNCRQCTSAGPAKCDSGRCDARYAYSATSQTCQGEQSRPVYAA